MTRSEILPEGKGKILMFLQRQSAVAVTAFVFAATACASPQSSRVQLGAPASEATPSSERGRGQLVDWDYPIQGTTVTSISAARSSLPFSPREPQNLGSTVRIIASSPAIAFVFDAPQYGRVLVGEELEDASLVEFQRSIVGITAAQNSNPNLTGRFDVITLKERGSALLTTLPSGLYHIEWREGQVRFRVTGRTLTKDQIIAIGETA